MVNIAIIYTDVDYKNYCKRLYNNRYLWEDLLQEFFIKMHTLDNSIKEKICVSELDLKKYSFVVIKSLFYQKERKKSSLFELSNEDELNEIIDEIIENDEFPDLISEYPTLGIKNLKKYCKDNRISYTAMKVKNHRIRNELKQKYGSIHKT
jgi:DNA-directed RNA polymerase specialized sigma24 family protein